MAAANTAKNAYGTGNNNQSGAYAINNASSRLSADALSRLGTGVVQQPTASRTNSGGKGVYTPRIVGSSTPVRLNNYSLKSSAGDTGNPPSGGGGGGGSAATVTGGGGGGGYSGGSGEDIISKIKALLEEQKKAADEYANSLFQQAVTKAEQESESNRFANNLNYMRADRYLKSLYGTGGPVGGGDPSTKYGGSNISGQGLSNRYRNYSNWQNRGTAIRQDLANNKNTLEAQRSANLMNNAGTLAQGWYNYVLPYYSQDALNKLDYAYRSSLL